VSTYHDIKMKALFGFFRTRKAFKITSIILISLMNLYWLNILLWSTTYKVWFIVLVSGVKHFKLLDGSIMSYLFFAKSPPSRSTAHLYQQRMWKNQMKMVLTGFTIWN